MQSPFDHVFSQTLANIEYLEKHRVLDYAMAQTVKQTLITAGHSYRLKSPALSSPSSTSSYISSGSSSARSMSSLPGRPVNYDVKAVWPYAQTGDLTFYPFGTEPVRKLPFVNGDIIHIFIEHSSEWYSGVLNDCTGLVPANFVQRIELPRAMPKTIKGDTTESISTLRSTSGITQGQGYSIQVPYHKQSASMSNTSNEHRSTTPRRPSLLLSPAPAACSSGSSTLSSQSTHIVVPNGSRPSLTPTPWVSGTQTQAQAQAQHRPKQSERYTLYETPSVSQKTYPTLPVGQGRHNAPKQF